jgi:hypothetical protein
MTSDRVKTTWELIEAGLVARNKPKEWLIDSHLLTLADLHDLMKGTKVVDKETADKLARSLGPTVDYWLDVDQAYQADVARRVPLSTVPAGHFYRIDDQWFIRSVDKPVDGQTESWDIVSKKIVKHHLTRTIHESQPPQYVIKDRLRAG